MTNASNAYSKEYVPLVNYDRVWESVSLDWFHGPVKYMKFDGAEEINGKTYHRIVTFKKTMVDNGEVVDDGNEYPMDVYEIEGYVREEDGKVYALVVGYDEGSLFTGMPYYPGHPYEDCEMTEQLIYDFSLGEGGSFDAFACSAVGGYMFKFTVDSKTTVSVDGQDCVKFTMEAGIQDDYGENHFGDIEIVEGVGSVNRGCLLYNEFFYCPTKPKFFNYFNRLFDGEGNVLYKSQDALDFLDLPTEGIFSSVEYLPSPEVIHIYDGNIYFGEGGKSCSIDIYGIDGNIRKSIAGQGRQCLSVADLSHGVYITVSQTEGGQAVCRKIVIK